MTYILTHIYSMLYCEAFKSCMLTMVNLRTYMWLFSILCVFVVCLCVSLLCVGGSGRCVCFCMRAHSCECTRMYVHVLSKEYVMVCKIVRYPTVTDRCWVMVLFLQSPLSSSCVVSEFVHSDRLTTVLVS